jgi:hypothetical protein
MDENNIVPDQNQQQPQEGLGSEIVSTAYKYDGWKMRINAIIYVVFSVIIFFGGLLFSFIFHTFVVLLVAMFPVIILLPVAWYTWKRGKVLSKEGKFSPPWKVN